MGDIRLICGDVRRVLRAKDPEQYAACLCDPPYGLKFANHRWDYDVPSVETWREILRTLKPGAPLLAFGGSRTYHRLTVAIEDAGFEIRDCLIWLYSTGMPKGQELGAQLDKRAGAERKVSGYYIHPDGGRRNEVPRDSDRTYGLGHPGRKLQVTAPETPEARKWDGYSTVLKPSWEPVILARKPFSGTVVDNALKHGTGPLNIDRCRIPLERAEKLGGGAVSADRQGWERPWKRDAAKRGAAKKRIAGNVARAEQLGRYPTNVLIDPVAAAMLENQSSGASRFFYVPKVSRRERGSGNDHPTCKPVRLIYYLATLILPPEPGRLLIPFSGSGSEMIGARFSGWKRMTGIEIEARYVAIAQKRLETFARFETLEAFEHDKRT